MKTAAKWARLALWALFYAVRETVLGLATTMTVLAYYCCAAMSRLRP